MGISFTPLTMKTEKKITATGRRETATHASESPVNRTLGKWCPLEKATLMLKLAYIWAESRQSQAAEVSDPRCGAQDFNL